MKKLNLYFSISNSQKESHTDFLKNVSSRFNLINIFDSIDQEKLVTEELLLLGGDGSLNYLVNKLGKKLLNKLKIIYIPTGTANDFSRSLNLSKPHFNYEFISEIINRNTYIQIPIIRFNDKKFINVATAGLPATVTDSDEGIIKEQTGVFSYYLSALSKLFSETFYNIEIESDNENFKVKTNGFIISQGLYAGGGIKVTPNYIANFGEEFSLLINKKKDIVNTVSSAIKIQKETNNFEDENIEVINTKSVTIRSSDLIPYKLDGEEVFTKEAKIYKENFFNIAIY